MSNLNSFFKEIKNDNELKELDTDFERAQYLQQILVEHATGGTGNEKHYSVLRSYFLQKHDTKALMPSWIKVNRNLSQFWSFIKQKFSTYNERRNFIWKEFNPLISYLEFSEECVIANNVFKHLEVLSSEYINTEWEKALDRKDKDPDGAITIARTVVESVLKHILDELGISYENKEDLKDLYNKVSKELNLSPGQHNEEIFKRILGGCFTVINGLSSLRNYFGDAHGKGKKRYRPKPRHAELAINLAGSLCLFIIDTYLSNKRKLSQ